MKVTATILSAFIAAAAFGTAFAASDDENDIRLHDFEDFAKSGLFDMSAPLLEVGNRHGFVLQRNSVNQGQPTFAIDRGYDNRSPHDVSGLPADNNMDFFNTYENPGSSSQQVNPQQHQGINQDYQLPTQKRYGHYYGRPKADFSQPSEFIAEQSGKGTTYVSRPLPQIPQQPMNSHSHRNSQRHSQHNNRESYGSIRSSEFDELSNAEIQTARLVRSERFPSFGQDIGLQNELDNEGERRVPTQRANRAQIKRVPVPGKTTTDAAEPTLQIFEAATSPEAATSREAAPLFNAATSSIHDPTVQTEDLEQDDEDVVSEMQVKMKKSIFPCKNKKKTCVVPYYTDYLLAEKNDFTANVNAKGIIQKTNFPKLPLSQMGMTDLESTILSEYEAYDFLRNARKSFSSDIKFNLFPGEYVLQKLALTKGLKYSAITFKYESNAINDKIFGRLTGPYLRNDNELQKKLYPEFVCKESLIAHGFLAEANAKYIHIGHFCQKLTTIIYSIEHSDSIANVTTFFEESRRQNPDFDKELFALYLLN